MRWPARHRNSSIIGCGNLGAPRMPPCTGSIRPAIWFAARSSSGTPITTLALGAGALGQTRHQRAAVLLDALWVLAEDALDLAQEIDEGRFAVARGLGEIGAAPERLAIGREKHGERPAAVLAEVMQRRHVDLIDVGTLLAIHFDVDEEVVHHLARWLRPRSSRAP